MSWKLETFDCEKMGNRWCVTSNALGRSKKPNERSMLGELQMSEKADVLRMNPSGRSE